MSFNRSPLRRKKKPVKPIAAMNDRERKLHRIFKHLSPATQAKFIQAGYTPKRGGANKLTYDDLCLIERLDGAPSEPVESVPPLPTAEIIPFKPK